MDTTHSVTDALSDWNEGKTGAGERLMLLVGPGLNRRAQALLRHERRNHTLQGTALVNEGYLRLAKQQRMQWRNREHFLAIATSTMKRVLLDHGRRRKAAKRGGGVNPLSLDEAIEVPDHRAELGYQLHWALTALEREAPRQHQVFMLNVFAGLSLEETAAALEVSVATVRLDKSKAKSFLRQMLREGGNHDS